MSATDLDASGLPRNRLWQPTTAKWFVVVFGACLLYAIVRYHIVGDVEWVHFPLFILNKVTSLAAVIFIACSYLVGRTIKWHNDDKVVRLTEARNQDCIVFARVLVVFRFFAMLDALCQSLGQDIQKRCQQ